MQAQPSTLGGGASSATASAVITGIREFLAFKLGSEEYGIDILRVQEIRSYEPPTCMANALVQVNYDTFTVVIVLNIGKQVIGMVVDGVSDVITLTPEQLHPVPDFSSAIDSNHVMAIGSVQDRMLILLDIEKLMSGAEMGLVTQALQ